MFFCTGMAIAMDRGGDQSAGPVLQHAQKILDTEGNRLQHRSTISQLP